MTDAELQDIETRLFFEAMAVRHGYDFRHYARASMKRRVQALAQSVGCPDIGSLIPRVLREEGFLGQALAHLSVPVTEMFRDPAVFLALRREVLPILDSYPRISVWQPGCATGEEPYSLAVLFEEEGMLPKAQIYATDINDMALAKAEEAIYPARNLAAYARNYAQAGGKTTLADYFTTAYDFSKISEPLRQKVVFAHHNLVADGVFCEVHMVLCRNVLIYFDRTLQNRVLALFHDSLVRGGFLCLGKKETLEGTDYADRFRPVDRDCRIWRKAEAS